MGDSPHFTSRECSKEQRRAYFRLAARLSDVLGGINAVERALGVSKGIMYRRAAGRSTLKYETTLALEALAMRLGVITRGTYENQPETE